MKTNWQDPGSTEITSPMLSGLQEAVGKIEDSIGLQTTAETAISLVEVYINADDRYRIFQAPLGKRNWVASPAPVIKKNGVAITTGFTIDYGGGAIMLDTAALSTDVFTADFTRTNDANSLSGVRTARFVIGTSTAGWTSADCDCLCDGTADDVEINAAITALPATGGEIVILDGTYNITAKIDVNKSNVSIRGNGNATILKRMWNSGTYDPIEEEWNGDIEGVIHLEDVSGCKIENLQTDGNKINYTSWVNCGIYLGHSSNNTITGNTCNNNGFINLFSSSNNTITGNNCNNNSIGIYLDSSSNNTITGNTCNSSEYDGIYLDSSSNNTITGNNCNNNSIGIYLSSSSDNAITGNTCNNNGIGINLFSSSNNTITGNNCNNNSIGIYLDSSSNNTVTGNTCNSSEYDGIYLDSSSNNTITGNTCIRGTGLSTDYTAIQHTIQLEGTSNSYNLISNNNCMGKAVTNEGGTGNTLVNNKFDAS